MTSNALLFIFACVVSVSCTTGSSPQLHSARTDPGKSHGLAIPATLPADSLQPWEQLNSEGFVVPRSPAAVDGASEFFFGAQDWDRSANALDNSDVMELDSASGTCWSIYRIPLGGGQPGVVSVDANLAEHNSGGQSDYWVGVADYASGSWDWRGPFADAHVRISTVAPAASYVSTLGSLFVCIVTDGGSRIEVVGVGANPKAAADTTPPPQVSGLSITPHSGAVELNWNNVVAGDLAGYRVYYRDRIFADSQTLGVKSLPYLIGRTSCMLPGNGTLFVRVAAVDVSGNQGPVSEVASADIPAGTPPLMTVAVDNPSVLVNDVVQATASGADIYDWDIDGDGVFEITGDPTGSQAVDTSAAGVIRPLVRGTAGGTAVTHSAVSVIVSGNSRPIAMGYADPASGGTPLLVNFSGLANDFDGTISRVAWDFDGDKTYEWSSFTVENPPPHVFNTPGTYNAKYRIWDDKDAWDSDTVTVTVLNNQPPVAILAADRYEAYLEIGPAEIVFNAAGSFDPDGGALTFEYDPLGSGGFTGSTDTFNFAYPGPGTYLARVRVTDPQGAISMDSISIRIYAFRTINVSSDFFPLSISLAVVDGRPAACFIKNNPGDDDLYYVSATNVNGTSWAAPQAVVNTVDVGYNPSLAEVDGHPAIAFYDATNDDLKYVRSSESSGDYWSWGSVVTVQNVGNTGIDPSMVVVAGNPAIAYRNNDIPALEYIRALDTTGSSWGAPVSPDTGLSLNDFSMKVIDGRPAIAYYFTFSADLKYVWAADAVGSAWNPAVTLDATGLAGREPELSVLNGRPAIVYSGDDMKFIRSTTASGVVAGDWAAPVVIVGGSWAVDPSMVELQGRPAVSWYHSGVYQLWYTWAEDANGTVWPPSTLLDGLGFGTGQGPKQLLVNGRPLVVADGGASNMIAARPMLE